MGGERGEGGGRGGGGGGGGGVHEATASVGKAPELGKTLFLSQSIWSHQFGEPKHLFAPKLTDLYHRPSMST